MGNAQKLLNTLKILNDSQQETKKNTDMSFGEVISVSPLSIKVDNKFYIDEDFLILTTNVLDHNVTVEMNWVTENTSGGSGEASFASHNHDIIGSKTLTMKYGLIVGEKVILLRVKNGQEFIVLDRIR